MVDRLDDQVEKERRDHRILTEVIERGPIGINRLARETDVPEHKVRYSLRMLENDDLVEPTPDGAVPADDIADRISARNDGIDHLVDRLQALREIF
jgi:predicted transcriptional regulator